MATVTTDQSTAPPGAVPKRSLYQRFVAGALAFFLTFGGFFGAQVRYAPEAQAGEAAAALAAIQALGEAKKAVCGEDQSATACAEEAVEKGAGFIAKLEKCATDGDPLSCAEELAEEEEDKDKDKDDDQQTRMVPSTLYRMQAAFTGFYGNSLAGVKSGQQEEEEEEPEEGEDGETAPPAEEEPAEPTESFIEVWGGITRNPSTAGAFVGFDDGNFFDGKSVSMWGANQNQSGVTYSHKGINPEAMGQTQGMYDYMIFGSALSGIGADSFAGTGTGTLQSRGATGARFALGFTILLAYIGSGMVDVIFSFALGAINFLNPFRFLVGGAQEWSSSFAASMPDGYGSASRLQPLADFITDIYNGAIAWGWYLTVPITLGLFVAGALMFRRTDKMKGFKKVVTRMMFLGLGVPLLGVTFTGALNSMMGVGTSSAQINATRVVLSNYVDFETWAMDYRLALPGIGQVEWDPKTDQPTQDAQADARLLAFGVNRMVNENWSDVGTSPTTGLQKPKDMEAAVEDGKNFDISSSDAFQSGAFVDTVDLLMRYINQQTVSGASFASGVQTKIGELSRNIEMNEETRKEIAEAMNLTEGQGIGAPMSWIDNWKTVEKLENVKRETLEKSPNPLIQTAMNAGPQPGLYVNGEGDGGKYEGTMHFMTTPGAVANAKAGQCTASSLPDLGGSITECNMSPLTMYNYLNTSFDSEKALVDSSQESVSNSSRGLHYSVNAVGTGAMQIVYWFSAFSLLMSFTLIGFFYALAMMVSCIKRAFQLITAIPFALVGFIAGIAKVIVYAVTMIIEVIGTMFMYRVVQELLMALPAILEAPLVALFSGDDGSLAAMFGVAVTTLDIWNQNKMIATILITLLASSGVLVFTFMAMKMRGAFVTAMDEAATRMINKFLDTGVGGGTSGQGSGVRRAAGSAAGLAMATRALSGGGADADGGVDPTGTAGGTGSGPGGGSGGGGFDTVGFNRGNGIDTDDLVGMGATAGGLGGALLLGDGDNVAGLGDDAVAMDAASDATMRTASFDGGDDAVAGYGGDMTADADGNLVNGAGSDYVYGADGEPLTTSDIAPTNADGQLVGADGEVITGEQGQALTPSDVHGVDQAGNLIGADGQPITDAEGNPVKADRAALDGARTSMPNSVSSGASDSARAAVAGATDENGNLVGADGEVMRDSAGNLIPASSVEGVNAAGELVDASGNPITGADGEAISAGELGSTSSVSSANDFANMSDKEIAQAMQGENGFLYSPQEAAPDAGASSLAGGGVTSTPAAGESDLVTAGVGGEGVQFQTASLSSDGGAKPLGTTHSGGMDVANTVAGFGAQAAQSAGGAMGLSDAQAQTLGETFAQAPEQMSRAVDGVRQAMAGGGGSSGLNQAAGAAAVAGAAGAAGLGARGAGAAGAADTAANVAGSTGGMSGGMPGGGVPTGTPAGVNGFTQASQGGAAGGAAGGSVSAGQQAARAAVVAGGMAALNSMTNNSNSTMAQATGGGTGQRNQQPGAASSAMQAGARSMTRSAMMRPGGMGQAAVANVAITQAGANRDRSRDRDRTRDRDRDRSRNARDMDAMRDRARGNQGERSGLQGGESGLGGPGGTGPGTVSV
mgnify:CR=1 FL=1